MDEQKGKERNIAIKEGAYSMTIALHEALSKGNVIVFSEHGGQKNHTAILLCGRGVEIIKELKIENAKLNIILYHRENGLSHPDFNAEIEISKQAERIKELEGDKENLRQYASGLENAQNLITVRYRELEAKNESQAKQIEELGDGIERMNNKWVKIRRELETLLEQLIPIAEKADTKDDSEDTTIELAKQALLRS